MNGKPRPAAHEPDPQRPAPGGGQAGFTAALVWVLGLAVLGWVLWVLGRGPLAPPPIGSWSAVERWLDSRTSVTAAFALLRIVALATVAYLLLLTALALGARLLGLPRLLRAVALSSLPGARRAISAVAGVGLGATTTLVAVSPGVAPARPAAVEARPVTDGWRRDTDRVVIEQVRVAPAVLEAVDLPTSSAQIAPRAAIGHGIEQPTAMPVEPAASAPPAPSAPVRWTVRTGEHLWSIAEAHLGAAWGRTVTEAEIEPYWRALVETNRPTLPDPANPDLLFAGQSLTLPPAPADPQRPPAKTAPRSDQPASTTAPRRTPPRGAPPTEPSPSSASTRTMPPTRTTQLPDAAEDDPTPRPTDGAPQPRPRRVRPAPPVAAPSVRTDALRAATRQNAPSVRATPGDEGDAPTVEAADTHDPEPKISTDAVSRGHGSPSLQPEQAPSDREPPPPTLRREVTGHHEPPTLDTPPRAGSDEPPTVIVEVDPADGD